MGYVNFTWMSGNKNYFYMFDTLDSDDKNILEPPTVTVKTDGKIPKRPKGKINVLKVILYAKIQYCNTVIILLQLLTKCVVRY